MKSRKGFVSNSSSSSFVAIGFPIDLEGVDWESGAPEPGNYLLTEKEKYEKDLAVWRTALRKKQGLVENLNMFKKPFSVVRMKISSGDEFGTNFARFEKIKKSLENIDGFKEELKSEGIDPSIVDWSEENMYILYGVEEW